MATVQMKFLLSKVLEKHRDKVFLATKFGFRYKEDNLNPKNFLEVLYRRLTWSGLKSRSKTA